MDGLAILKLQFIANLSVHENLVSVKLSVVVNLSNPLVRRHSPWPRANTEPHPHTRNLLAGGDTASINIGR